MNVLLFAADEGGSPSNPILPEWSEMFWGAIAFFTLWALVKFVLLPPFLEVMDGRADKVRADLDAAEIARSKATSAASEVSDQLAGVRAEAAQILDDARAEAEAQRAEVIGRAEAEAAEIKAAAEAEIAEARAAAMSGIEPQVAELAADAASRVIKRDVSLDQAAPVVSRFLSNPN